MCAEQRVRCLRKISTVYKNVFCYLQDLRSCPMSMANPLAVWIKVLFPEPVTPITAMKTSGILSETVAIIEESVSKGEQASMITLRGTSHSICERLLR